MNANSPLPILYDDDSIVVIDKPCGLLVHKTPEDWHETEFALQRVRDQIGRRVFPVHRLDKGTSGALLFAKSGEIARWYQSVWQDEGVIKRYWAVVRGYLQGHGDIDHDLKHLETGAPQTAISHYRGLSTCEQPWAIERYPTTRYSLVELTLVQGGRRHQLRRHMKHLSHPIIGDSRYGKGIHNRYFAQKTECQRLMLHAQTLQIPHPEQTSPLAIQCPPKGSFSKALSQLGLHA